MEVNVEESSGRIGKLTAEPLERGFGLTLGNSIRRILLSSLQGAAITSVKIKGVVHEFSTIPGVKEDLTDILLNLKSIAVKVHSPGLKKMYLKSSGSGELRAGNFETDSETEIMNPNQLIMTLDSNADIEIEANIEIVIQRVKSASVSVDNKIIGEIATGFLILLGVEKSDVQDDLNYLVKKTVGLRIFKDANNNMNLSIKDVGGEAWVVSQFTLCADTGRGRRPSFIKAAN
jgi:DNA-directed RNA polymerase alpha subunit